MAILFLISGCDDNESTYPEVTRAEKLPIDIIKRTPESQIIDDVSGVWVSHRVEDIWTEAERVWLQEPGKLALDGATGPIAGTA